MGNYNCKECIQKDINNVNELQINNKYFSNAPDHNNIVHKDEEVFNLEENNYNKNTDNIVDNFNNKNISLRQKFLQNKNNSINEKTQNHFNNMQKEERENNILLKNELNKINNMNNIEAINSVKSNEEIKEVESIEENNENKDVKKELLNAEEIAKNQQKLIEQQKQQILDQQKILEQQNLKIQENQLKIKEQELQNKDLELQFLDTISQKQEKHSNHIQLKSPLQQINISSSKSSPKQRTNKINLNPPQSLQYKDNKKDQIKDENEEDKQIIDDQQEIIKFNKEEISKEEEENQEEEGDNQEEENQEIDNQEGDIQEEENQEGDNKDGQEEENQEEENQEGDNQDGQEEENQEEENQEDENQVFDGYVKVDDLDEIEDKDANYYHSQKFKIETYEPIEQGQKNENSENFDIDDNIENENSLKFKENIYKIEKKLEPKDNINSGKKKKVILKSRSSNNKDFYELVKKREDGPKDSGNKIINFHFRGTFNKEKEKNREFLQKIIKRESGPKDSKKKVKKNNKLYKECKLKANPYNKKKNYPRDKDEEEPIDADTITYAPIDHSKQYGNNIFNPITNAISNAVLNNDNYDTEINFNNYKNINNNINSDNIQNYQTNYQYANNNIVPSLQFPQELFNQNNNNNNIFVSQDIDMEQQMESPRFNEMIEAQNMEIFTDGNVNGNNEIKQQYGKSDIYGHYNNQMGDFNFAMSADPILLHNNEFNKYPSFKDNEQNQNKTNNSYEYVTGHDKDNHLIYSDDMGNMYLEKKYNIYQNQFNNNNYDGNF